MFRKYLKTESFVIFDRRIDSKSYYEFLKNSNLPIYVYAKQKLW